jgi:hypothetical protein
MSSPAARPACAASAPTTSTCTRCTSGTARPRSRRPCTRWTDGQLAENLAAASLVLSDDERTQLDQVSAPPLIYPFWHQAKTARDRLSPADLTLLAPHLQ